MLLIHLFTYIPNVYKDMFRLTENHLSEIVATPYVYTGQDNRFLKSMDHPLCKSILWIYFGAFYCWLYVVWAFFIVEGCFFSMKLLFHLVLWKVVELTIIPHLIFFCSLKLFSVTIIQYVTHTFYYIYKKKYKNFILTDSKQLYGFLEIKRPILLKLLIFFNFFG